MIKKIYIFSILLSCITMSFSLAHEAASPQILDIESSSELPKNKEADDNKLKFREQGGDKTSKYTFEEHQMPIKIKDTSFYDQNNKAHLFEEYENNVIILNFWATWCTFCTSKMQNLDRLQKNLKDEPVKIIAVSEDFKGLEVVEKFFKEKDLRNLEIFIDKKNSLFKTFEIVALPTAIIIDKKGFEVARIIGGVDWENDKKIKDLIAKYSSIPNDSKK